MAWTQVPAAAVVIAAPSTDGGSPTAAAQARWRDVAGAGRTFRPEDIAETARRLEGFGPEQAKRLEHVLDAMAAVEPGPAGIVQANQAMLAALPGLESPDADFSGEGPHRTALRRAGEMVLLGLVAREARRVAQLPQPDGEARALLVAIEALPGLGKVERARMMDEARHGLGDTLYQRARPSSGTPPQRTP